MRRVRLLEQYNGKQVGTIIEVENNDAHALIDMGVAELVSFPSKRPNKMVEAGKTKRLMKK